VFLVDNFRKFPKKSQNVTIYGSRLYTILDSILEIPKIFYFL